MLVLAIETSAKHYSLALLGDQDVICGFDSRDSNFCTNEADANFRHLGGTPSISRTLFPAISDLFRETGAKFNEIDLIAVAQGPGLFTGLRIGIVAAKTMAYAMQAEVIGVNTLEAISAQTAVAMSKSNALLRPVLNAQRKQLFAAAYRYVGDWTVDQIETDGILERSEWTERLCAEDIVTGSGLSPMVDQLINQGSQNDGGPIIAPSSVWDCTAEAIGRIGRNQFLAGRRDDFWKLEPHYFRPSAAEEVLLAKSNESAAN